MPADMVRQFRVRTCADRTRATGDRIRLTLADAPLIDAEKLFRQPGPRLTVKAGPRRRHAPIGGLAISQSICGQFTGSPFTPRR